MKFTTHGTSVVARAAVNPQPSTLNPQPSTLNTQTSTSSDTTCSRTLPGFQCYLSEQRFHFCFETRSGAGKTSIVARAAVTLYEKGFKLKPSW